MNAIQWSATLTGITWPDVIGAVGGAAGVVASILLGRRSLRVSRESRDEARRSADAAQESARAAAEVARMEREREHARLGPGPVPEIVAELETNPRGTNLPRTLFGTVTLPCDYQVRARAVTGNSYSPISLDLLLHAGQTYRFPIEQWASDRVKPQTEYVLFQFWPPADNHDVDPWTCPCHRPVAMVDDRTPGHWEWRAPIKYKPKLSPRVAVV